MECGRTHKKGKLKGDKQLIELGSVWLASILKTPDFFEFNRQGSSRHRPGRQDSTLAQEVSPYFFGQRLVE